MNGFALAPREPKAFAASRLTMSSSSVRRPASIGISASLTSPGFFLTQYESAIAASARLLRTVAALMMSAERLT